MLRSRPSDRLAIVHGNRLAGLRGAVLVLAALLLVSLGRTPAAGQDPDALRVGMTLGGTSFFGVHVEYRWTDRSVELTVGTWAFQDLSASVVGKQYLGPQGVQPYLGGGLWGVLAFTEPRNGGALIFRAPVGLDWRVLGPNFLGAELNVNRGLAVRRSDPGDDTPLNRRLVPLPGFYYRWRP